MRSSLDKDNIFLIPTIVPSESIFNGHVFTPILLPSYCCCGFSPSFLSFTQPERRPGREGGILATVTSVSSPNTRPVRYLSPNSAHINSPWKVYTGSVAGLTNEIQSTGLSPYLTYTDYVPMML